MAYIGVSDCFVCTLKNLDLAQIEAIVAEIEREKEAGERLLSSISITLWILMIVAEAERKRSRLAATAAGQAAMASRSAQEASGQ
jgi:20S proteasome subunit alpha 4